MNSKPSVSAALFGIALGWYFTFNLLRSLSPVGFVFTAIPLVALFWGYLTWRQNLILGVVRLIFTLPVMLRLSMRLMILFELILSVGDSGAYGLVVIPSGAIFALVIFSNLLIVLFVYFPVTYLVHRLYRRWGVYRRISRHISFM